MSLNKLDPRTKDLKERYEGKIFLTKDSSAEFYIAEVFSYKKVKIIFPLYNNFEIITNLNYIIKNKINNPFPGNNVVYFEDPYKKYMNCYYYTNTLKPDGAPYVIKVIDYQGTSKVTVEFQDEFKYRTVTTMQNIKNGQVQNPYALNKFGGYIGEGPFFRNKSKIPNYNNYYTLWNNILIRSYPDKSYYLKYHPNVKCYDECTIVPEWKCFNNFMAWYLATISQLNPKYQYAVDKDIKFKYYMTKTNYVKCYGPKYCVLMPLDLNKMIERLTNQLDINNPNKKISISDELRYYIELYYNDNAISYETYNILINY